MNITQRLHEAIVNGRVYELMLIGKEQEFSPDLIAPGSVYELLKNWSEGKLPDPTASVTIYECLRSGMDVDIKFGSGMFQQTPLTYVARFDRNDYLVPAVLAHRPQVDLVDGYGQTALMRAVVGGNPKAVKRLLDAGHDPSVGDQGINCFGMAHFSLAQDFHGGKPLKAPHIECFKVLAERFPEAEVSTINGPRTLNESVAELGLFELFT